MKNGFHRNIGDETQKQFTTDKYLTIEGRFCRIKFRDGEKFTAETQKRFVTEKVDDEEIFATEKVSQPRRKKLFTTEIFTTNKVCDG